MTIPYFVMPERVMLDNLKVSTALMKWMLVG